MNELERQRHRQRRLKSAIEQLTDGNVTTFGKKLGYKDGAFIRQMLSGMRPIREKTIEKIEAFPRMRGWFRGHDLDDIRITDEMLQQEMDVEPFTAELEKTEESVNTHSSINSSGITLASSQDIAQFVEHLSTAAKAKQVTTALIALLTGMLEQAKLQVAAQAPNEHAAQAATETNRKTGKPRLPDVATAIDERLERGVGGVTSGVGHEPGRKSRGSRKH